MIDIPSVDMILKSTKADYDEIVHNIARINSISLSELTEEETNTNMMLLLKRYVNKLPSTKLLISDENMLQIQKLLSVGDNITNGTFLRLTELLNVRWTVIMVNQPHGMNIRCDGEKIVDDNHEVVDCTLENMLLTLMKFVLDFYGELDMKLNVKYIQPYTVNNILTAVRYDRRTSSYLFEKFCKIWNISYSYTITSNIDENVVMDITLDPCGWM